MPILFRAQGAGADKVTRVATSDRCPANHLRQDGIPVASADFFYENRKLAIFVDGPPHDKDYVASADKEKRKKVRSLGYRVLAIAHKKMEDDLHTLKSKL